MIRSRRLRIAMPSWFKKAIEWMFNNRVGNALDNYLMQLTNLRWTRKEQQQRVNAHGNRMGLQTGKHFSKPNPVYFQKKVLDTLEKKLVKIEAGSYLNADHRPGRT